MEEISQKEGAAVRLPYDVIVVGAGAAGMMAAGTAARNGHRVLLLEKMEKSGRKVRITGKGRCNVTNARPPEEFAGQVRTNAEFFSTAFAEFNNKATIRFFERLGVKLDVERGELGFSERGIEGAVALRMSRDAVDALIDGKGVGLMVDLKPGLTEEMLRERIAREMAEMGPEEFFSELLRKLVPKALVIPLSEEVGAHSKNYIRKITPEQIERLVKLLKGMVFPISDYAPFEYAVVTAGGVSCEDVNRYTMESLKVKGLYFAGEVLDLDANTGGYNLQIAFSTGRLAGMLKQ